MFSALRSLRHGSIRDIAEHLGGSPESIHYHVKALLKAKLIFQSDRRITARKPEAIYQSIAQSLRLPDLKTQPELATLARKSVVAGLRQTIRGYESAAVQAELSPELRRHILVVRAKLRLSEEDTKHFLQMIEDAVDFARERDTDEGVRLNWSSIVYP